jgi:hypothetical protein
MEHLLRGGYGARSDELDVFRRQPIRGAVSFCSPTTRFQTCRPEDRAGRLCRHELAARVSPEHRHRRRAARWLFRMVLTQTAAAGEETPFWHNHVATAYTKIAGLLNPQEATR